MTLCLRARIRLGRPRTYGDCVLCLPPLSLSVVPGQSKAALWLQRKRANTRSSLGLSITDLSPPLTSLGGFNATAPYFAECARGVDQGAD